MALQIVANLFINKAAGQIEPLATSLINIAQPDAPDFVTRDNVTVNLWFCDPGATTFDPLQPNPIDAGDVIVFDGKPANDVSAADALFSGTDFEEMVMGVPISMMLVIENGGANYVNPSGAVVGGGGNGATVTLTQTDGVITGAVVTGAGIDFTSVPEIVITDTGPGAGAVIVAELSAALQYYYTTDVDFTADNLTAAVAATGNDVLAVICGVQVQNAGNTQRITYLFEANVYYTPYQGTEGAVAGTGDPPYPPPGQLLTNAQDTPNLKRGFIALAVGETTVPVVFTTAFEGGAPMSVFASVIKLQPGDDNVSPGGYDSITAAGFNVELSGGATIGSVLSWMALQ
jgi:hypothetical protein